MGGSGYTYDGAGNRIQQTVGVNVTQYLLDLQPGLAVVLAETTGANTNRYVHGPMGIHAQEDNSGNWTWPLQDGLGSVRGVVNDSLGVQGARHFASYGEAFGQQGSIGLPFAYTGEMRDPIGLQYHRARYYHPVTGSWLSLDPLESGNRYAYAGNNPVNNVDPSGMLFWSFPRGGIGTKEDLYEPEMYSTMNPSDGSCPRAFAHSWIARWLEVHNGGVWQTHLEFPGRGKRLDALVLPNAEISSNQLIARGEGAVFEVEPAQERTSIIHGYGEIREKQRLMNAALPPHSKTGTLPNQHSWNPPSDMGSLAGQPYDWSGVTGWKLGDALAPGVGRVSLPPSSGGNGCPLYSTTGSNGYGRQEAEIRYSIQAGSAAVAEQQWQEHPANRR